MRNSTKILASLLMGASMLVPVAAASAQTQNSNAHDEGLEEEATPPANPNDIIVTATKRAQTLEEIPLAVTVLTKEDLERRNATSFNDYLPSVPGVQFNPAANLFSNSISVRGVTDGSTNFLTQAPVALYLDDTLLTLAQGAVNLDYGVFGVEQINIIKGPNSTLYGASSLGGTIKVQTRRPSLTDVRAEARGGISSTDEGGTNWRLSGSVSAPLVEGVLSAEATGYYVHDAGFIDTPGGESNANSRDTYGGRLAFRFQPTDRLTVDLTGYYQNIESDDLELIAFDSLDTLEGPAILGDQFQNDEIYLASLNVKYDLDFAELTSSTSYFDRRTEVLQDISLTFLNFLPGTANGSLLTSNADRFAQELRLASTGNGPVSWLVGAYYSNETLRKVTSLTAGPPGVSDTDLNFEYDTYAIFAEVGVELVKGLTLTAGGRQTWYDTSVDFGGAIFFSPVTLVAGDSETDFSPRVALNYEYGSGSVYAQASRGFRLGQANVPIPLGAANGVPQFFGPDDLWNYEIGAKTSWLDNSLFVNAAAYFIDWNNIQLNLVCAACNGFTFIGNAGSARIKGFEIEATAYLSPTTTWSGGVGYIDGELTDDVPTVAPDGARLPGSPEWTWNTSLQQEISIGNNKGFLRADMLYYGPYDDSFVLGGAPAENGDYVRLDLRAGVAVGAVDLTVFVTNLLDERPILTRAFFPVPSVTTLQPRTIGATVGFRF